jgi:uncharacterized membrane protein
MQPVIETLKSWQLHPFVDHFTVGLILIGILTDLVASVFAARVWLRYMALSLMIVGALAAAGSNVTGGWEAGRVWDSVSGPGKDVLRRHAQIGDILPWVFGGLALWRLGVQFVGFIAGSRPLYLVFAIVGGAAIVYQGHLGARMVYDYGIGTAFLTSGQAASPSPLPLSPVPTPEVMRTPGPPSSFLPSPIPSAAPTTAPSPASSTPVTPPPMAPSPTPITSNPPPAPSAGEGGATLNPSPSESPTPGAKNL